jgi:hypothetical protein
MFHAEKQFPEAQTNLAHIYGKWPWIKKGRILKNRSIGEMAHLRETKGKVSRNGESNWSISGTVRTRLSCR